MSPTPTGRLSGDDLVLTRTFRAPVDDVWASLTESERTARWFGPWQGDAAPGNTIKVQMSQEEGAPWTDMTIEACEPPRRLALSAVDEYGSWDLDLVLTESGGVTELRFTQHLTGTENVGEVGPGWEFYLDALVASREGAPAPDFNDYFPAMKEHFESQRPAG
ncbi:SRPBCC family protein [Actinoplanes sp. NEAU-A12]|uniref:SRPBCC family protein n=1 Tax=Actinoplanes sandaracinus TaxID=3045177 RepID=A0ABT6WHX0_9ACTN|nr:SRPBCC family protein [Actinoplanes sandaracinus]MDI6099303.1 SRPBCC family protein [Actinoplanes sandaracinus]